VSVDLNLCIRARALSARTITTVLHALVEINVEIYSAGLVTRSPWRLRWVPDGYAPTSTLRDAQILDDAGEGSCGELAAAYAAWLIVHKHGDAGVELLSDGPNAWHVRALQGSTVYDPQILGDLQNGSPHHVG
jgi:hypothetical protein